MKIGGIEVEQAVETARKALREEAGLSSGLRAALEVLLMLVTVLLNRVTLDSHNSSTPPSQDRNREKPSRRGQSGRTRGGQPGHLGTTLMPVEEPDEVQELAVDQTTLPPGGRYREAGFERRQVIDLDISRFVIEYRAQILEDDRGERYVAPFPDGVTRPVHYGRGVKAHAVYLSQFQLLPYDRIRDQLQEQMEVPVSAGSVYNFNREAYERLEGFETWVKDQLAEAKRANADETGINIDGKGHWLHCLSNDDLTLFYPHAKRGTEAMDEIGVLPRFRGILCHNHRADVCSCNIGISTLPGGQSPTTATRSAPTPCATPITCGNWSEPGSTTAGMQEVEQRMEQLPRMVSNGPRRCRTGCWRSTPR